MSSFRFKFPVLVVAGAVAVLAWQGLRSEEKQPPPVVLSPQVQVADVSATTVNPCAVPLPQPGYPRAWEAGLQAGTYTMANTRHGNLLTVIPLVGWGGVGPDLSFGLFHNSANVDSTLNLTRGMGFDLGDGWTTSYSAHLIHDDQSTPSTVTVFHDDGTRDVFTDNGSAWVAPAGVYDELTYVSAESVWRLAHKDQSYTEFDSDGLLSKIVDPFGNELTITRDAVTKRLDAITDAANRRLNFKYDSQNGELLRVEDPNEGVSEPGPSTLPAIRSWVLTYDANDRLSIVEDPDTFQVRFTYEASGVLDEITDKDGDAYAYDYDAAYRIDLVTDPVGRTPRLTQAFAYTCDAQAGTNTTTFTDRRGQNWVHVYNSDGEIQSSANPLNNIFKYDYDSNRNLTRYTDARNKSWIMTYDAFGNMLTVTDPLTHVSTWTYDSFNNMTSYTDADNHTWTFKYSHTEYDTLLTSVDEPGVGYPPVVATTRLEYYGSKDPPYTNGLLKEVTDPNGVATAFAYDVWGQPASVAEGEIPGRAAYGATMEVQYDSGTRAVRTTSPMSGGLLYRKVGNGSIYDVVCPPIIGQVSDPLPPAGFPVWSCSQVPEPPALSSSVSFTYNNMGLPLTMESTLTRGLQTYSRDHSYVYDELGIPTSVSVTTDETSPSLTRTFGYSVDIANGTSTRTGPDGVETYIKYDLAGREKYMRRGPSNDPLMEVAYNYDANGRLIEEIRENDTEVYWTYDDAGRLLSIEHLSWPEGGTILLLEYTYSDAGLIETIDETTDSGGNGALVTYTYDARGRLTSEVRTGENPYSYTYAYDAGGNRTLKLDNLDTLLWLYHYDIEDVNYTESHNNRLMHVEKFDYPAGGGTPDLVSTTYYYYNANGNVKRIITETPDASPGVNRTTYDSLRLVYAQNGDALTYVISETCLDDDGSQFYTFKCAYEYRYDGPAERYLVRELDSNLNAISETWSDYDGGSIYGDFEVVSGSPVNTMSYEGGLAKASDPLGTPVTSYYHTDHLGTTRLMTDGGGWVASSMTFTAYGESVSGTAQRYGYAGAHGYQTGPEVPFQHLGHRYYDPSIGRFLQRDPLGIGGGLNVYCYVGNNPITGVDPLGLANEMTPIFEGGGKWKNGGRWRGAKGRFVKVRPPWWQKIKFRWGSWGAAGGIASCGALLILVTEEIVVPAWEAHMDRVEEDANDKFGRPFNPNDPWDWVEGTSWEGKKPKKPSRSSDNCWYCHIFDGLCFVEGTLVFTSNGFEPIENIAAGVLVHSSPMMSNFFDVREVVRTQQGFSCRFIEISLPNEKVMCTPFHPFWVVDEGWVEAELLEEGMSLWSIEGKEVRIEQVRPYRSGSPMPVYNMSVGELETYFVGESKVLVHNKTEW